jgi:hypothetical protein
MDTMFFNFGSLVKELIIIIEVIVLKQNVLLLETVNRL